MSSCASKEDIYYLQDAELNAVGEFVYESSLIQPNDILKITVDSSEPLTHYPIIGELPRVLHRTFKLCNWRAI